MTQHPEWIDLGPGACDGEVLRGRPFANGTLVTVIRQRKGYKRVSVTNPDPRDGLLEVQGEQTIGVFFLPGLRVGVEPVAPVSSTATPEASPPAPSPSPSASLQEHVPAAAGAGATASR